MLISCDNNRAMPSISRVLYCVSKRGLAFTLPCLSKTELNYVTIQTQPSFLSMASRLPIPRYFFSLTPSW